jgi:hypothetical protein
MPDLSRLWSTITGGAGHFPVPETDSGAIRRLLTRLHPVEPARPLIRLGPSGDGGYLLPDDLEGITACFSPGVSDISGFEHDCAERGMQVFMADASVCGPAEQHPRFHFERKFLAATTSDQYMTLDNWVSRNSPGNTDLLLQMDIEGFEYEVLLAASDSLLQRFRIMVIEFHQLDQLWNRPWFELAGRVFDKLLQTHVCVHLHPNNFTPLHRHRGFDIPPLLEFTLLRRDRVAGTDFAQTCPHPLDSDNVPGKRFDLPPSWYHPGVWPAGSWRPDMS